MREEAIIHKVKITMSGQTRSFQIPLPGDAERIIGIETSCQHAYTYPAIFPYPAMYPSPPPVLICVNSIIIGEITLMHFGSDIFYSGYVRPHDHNLQFVQIADKQFLAWPHTHGTKAFDEKVNVSVTTRLIEAHYRDRWGEMIGGQVDYELTIVVWIRKKNNI